MEPSSIPVPLRAGLHRERLHPPVPGTEAVLRPTGDLDARPASILALRQPRRQALGPKKPRFTQIPTQQADFPTADQRRTRRRSCAVAWRPQPTWTHHQPGRPAARTMCALRRPHPPHLLRGFSRRPKPTGISTARQPLPPTRPAAQQVQMAVRRAPRGSRSSGPGTKPSDHGARCRRVRRCWRWCRW